MRERVNPVLNIVIDGMTNLVYDNDNDDDDDSLMMLFLQRLGSGYHAVIIPYITRTRV